MTGGPTRLEQARSEVIRIRMQMRASEQGNPIVESEHNLLIEAVDRLLKASSPREAVPTEEIALRAKEQRPKGHD